MAACNLPNHTGPKGKNRNICREKKEKKNRNLFFFFFYRLFMLKRSSLDLSLPVTFTCVCVCIVNWFGSRSRERPVRIDHVADSSRRLFNKKTTDSIGGVVMRDEMRRGIKVFVFFFSFFPLPYSCCVTFGEYAAAASAMNNSITRGNIRSIRCKLDFLDGMYSCFTSTYSSSILPRRTGL